MPSIDDHVCPGCGEPVSVTDKVCPQCGRKLDFSSVTLTQTRKRTYKEAEQFLKANKGALSKSPDNPDVLAAQGFRLLDNQQFKEASEALEKAIKNGSDDSDVFFEAAIAHFRCSKPYQIKLAEAKAIIHQIDSALEMDHRASYLYAKYRLIHLLFERRYLHYSEKSADVLRQAQQAGLSEGDKSDINARLGIK